MSEKEEKQTSNDDNQQAGEKSRDSVNRSRRKALKTLAAGTAAAGTMALTGKWSKPVVNSIILPAHAQATNPTGPTATTTPAATTTSESCARVDEMHTCINVVRDQQTHFVTSATINGSVTPAQGGVAINASFRSFSQITQESHDYSFQTTTNAAGSFSAGQTFTPADQVTEISAGYAGTPCNGSGTDIGPCGNGG